MAKNKSWSKKEDIYLTKLVLKATKNGLPIMFAFEVASKKLDRSLEGVKMHWYGELNEKYKNKITQIKKMRKCKKEHNFWSNRERKELIKYVVLAIKNNKTIEEAFRIASKKLGRTFKACHAQWYNVLMKKPEVNEYIQKVKMELGMV